MLLAEIVQASTEVAATRSRKAKVAILAQLLARAVAEDDEILVAIAASWLGGSLRQRRTGIGYRSLSSLPPAAASPSLTIGEVDERLQEISELSGAGSSTRRSAMLADLMSGATDSEQRYLRALITGEVRQGALDSLVQEAAAAAAEVDLAAVRRAAMLAGSTADAVTAALLGGAWALAEFGLVVGRPVLPMLASSTGDVAAAIAKAGGGVVVLDAKLDGIRIQVHKRGDEVLVVTRSLDDITARLPEVVDVVRGLAVSSAILDGEAMLVDEGGRPRPFQETAARTATHSAGSGSSDPELPTNAARVTPYFFDVLHVDGIDYLDEPTRVRLAALDAVVPAENRVDRLVTDDAKAAESFAARTLRAGHEGVIVKDLGAAYDAGRRGSAWVKVKPVHTLDLVVLAVEEGSGRRRGWLSNIHLGARDAETGNLVMVGKTFKGMTDEMLAWQTERFTELMVERNDWVFTVRPEQVVEVAFDGVQRSTRYPGGVALRFARVVRYRDDKSAAEADTIQTLRSHLAN